MPDVIARLYGVEYLPALPKKQALNFRVAQGVAKSGRDARTNLALLSSSSPHSGRIVVIECD